MKKSSLAEISHAALTGAQLEDHSKAAILHILETSFSALATLDPEFAINVIDQLKDKAQECKELAADRAQEKAEYLKVTVESLPDVLEFQDESEEDEDEDDFSH